MPTFGQARYLNENINTFIGLTFVAVFALAMGLAIWHAATDKNPVADFLSQQHALSLISNN